MSLIGKLVVGAAMAFAATTAQASDAAQLEKNKKTIVEFYNKFLNEKDIDAAVAMIGPTYKQHNAFIKDGKDGFREFFIELKKKYPHLQTKIIRVFAEGDFVILHVHTIREPGTRGEAIMDIFRLEDGKPVEHWDVIQPIPENIPHNNTMF